MKARGACASVAGVLLGIAGCGYLPDAEPGPPAPRRAPDRVVSRPVVPQSGPTASTEAPDPADGPAPVVLTDCRLKVAEKQDVPSQREGVLLFVGTEIRTGEAVPADRLITVDERGVQKRYRRLREGDVVEPGQLVARLDDRLAYDEWAIRKGKLAVSEADLAIAEKTRDEAKERFETEARLQAKRATSHEQVRTSRLTWEKFVYEAVGKKEALELTRREVHQAETVLQMYEVHSALRGIVKAIYKHPGEAVRALEPVVQIHALGRLQAEGLAGTHELPYLRPGLRAVIEPMAVRSPRQLFVGHLQEVTGVAVCPGEPALIVSGSEDGTVRTWDRANGRERRVFRAGAPVRSLACGGQGGRRLALAGLADGRVALWDLDAAGDEPTVEWTDHHRGAVICAAFSPDGRWAITGGEDRSLCSWDVAGGTLHARLAAAHRGAVTSVRLTADGRLLSAGRDNTLRTWRLEAQTLRPELTFDSRSGAVPQLDATADGRAVLFDQGRSLRLLSLPDGRTRWVLDGPGGVASFASFALLAPDARLLLSAGSGDGRLLLWRVPAPGLRGQELCQLTARQHVTPTCAAFAPDGSFVVAGTRERGVLLWPVPERTEIERQVAAELTLVEHAVDSTTSQVRVCAEVNNADGRLLPGGTVTLVIYPER